MMDGFRENLYEARFKKIRVLTQLADSYGCVVWLVLRKPGLILIVSVTVDAIPENGDAAGKTLNVCLLRS